MKILVMKEQTIQFTEDLHLFFWPFIVFFQSFSEVVLEYSWDHISLEGNYQDHILNHKLHVEEVILCIWANNQVDFGTSYLLFPYSLFQFQCFEVFICHFIHKNQILSFH